MKGFSIVLATVAAVLAAPSHATAQGAGQQEMQFAQFFVGTWNCAHTVGDFSGTYKTTIANVLDNRWLKQTYDFPVSKGRAAVQGEFFIGYEPRNGKWLRFGAMSDGLYFTMVGTRSENVWTWGYLLPGTKGSAVYRKTSESGYTVDGPSYPENGRTVTEHHVCRKSS
jgi:hypothetical protein